MTTPLTPDDLARLAELLAKATPDWRLSRHGVIVGGPFNEYTNGRAQSQIAMTTCAFGDDVRDANAALIAEAITALPALLAMARDSLRWEEAAIAMRNTHGCLARDCEQCAAIDAALREGDPHAE